MSVFRRAATLPRLLGRAPCMRRQVPQPSFAAMSIRTRDMGHSSRANFNANFASGLGGHGVGLLSLVALATAAAASSTANSSPRKNSLKKNEKNMLPTEDEDEDEDEDLEPQGDHMLEDASQESSVTPMRRAKVFSGRSNRKLAEEIAQHLGMKLGAITVGRFADGEVNVMVDENVRGQDIYIIQPTCPPKVNENLVELLLMISTMRRASARRITAVIPYYGYARQDRKMTSRVPISAADVARLLEAMGVDRVIAVDLHCGQIQGFFGPRVPVDNLEAAQTGVDYFGKLDPPLKNPVIVSPDAGGVYRAQQFQNKLHKLTGEEPGIAMIIKQRAKAGVIRKMDLVGTVDGCDAIIVDDMIDSGGTLCKAAKEIENYGANRVFAFATHGLFSGNADKNIRESCMEQVVVVNTVPLAANMETNPKLTQLSVAPLLADAIRRVHARKSVSELFSNTK